MNVIQSKVLEIILVLNHLIQNQLVNHLRLVLSFFKCSSKTPIKSVDDCFLLLEKNHLVRLSLESVSLDR